MSIKILGKNPKFIKHCTCTNCASVLEYTAADTQSKPSKDYDGGTCIVVWLVCPVCSQKVYLSN